MRFPKHSFRTVAVAAVMLAATLAAGAADAPVSAFGAAFAQWSRGEHKPALKTFAQLAEAGDVRAQVLYGFALLEGKDIPRDVVKGYAWLKIASSPDVYSYANAAGATARQQVAALEPRMTGADLVGADRIVGPYVEAHNRDYGERLKSAAYVLTGRSASATVATAPGCALDRSIGGCEEARKVKDWAHSCTGNIMVPDLPANTNGSDASLVQPDFPNQSPAWEGSVNTLVHVDTTGFVCQVALLRSTGSREIDQAVLNAVRTWRFQPGIKSGTAVESLAEARIENLIPVAAPATPAR